MPTTARTARGGPAPALETPARGTAARAPARSREVAGMASRLPRRPPRTLRDRLRLEHPMTTTDLRVRARQVAEGAASSRASPTPATRRASPCLGRRRVRRRLVLPRTWTTRCWCTWPARSSRRRRPVPRHRLPLRRDPRHPRRRRAGLRRSTSINAAPKQTVAEQDATAGQRPLRPRPRPRAARLRKVVPLKATLAAIARGSPASAGSNRPHGRTHR